MTAGAPVPGRGPRRREARDDAAVAARGRAPRASGTPARARARAVPVGPASADLRVVPAARGRTHPYRVLAILCVSLLVVSLDTTILNVALPTLARVLHAGTNELQWIVDAYALTFGGLLLVAGDLADRRGRRAAFVAGLLVFGAGSAGAAFSGNADLLVAARAGMGLGSAFVMPATLSILVEVFPEPARRARAIGIWSGTTGLGVALGPVVGGFLLAHFFYGSVFLVNVPIVAAGAAAVLVAVPESRGRPSGRPDLAGVALSVAGLGLLLWGIIEAPVDGFASPTVVAAVAAGAGLLGAFFVWERRTPHPMLRLALFANRRFSAAVGAVSLALFALSAVLFVLTQYLQFGLGFTPLSAGLRLAPVALVLALAAPLSALAARAVGTKVVVAGGLATIALGLSLLARTTTTSTFGSALPGMLLLGIGTGLTMAPSTESVMGSLGRDETGVGAATNSTLLQVGGALGVAVLGSLLAAGYRARLVVLLAGRPIPPAAKAAVLSSLGGALAVAHRAGGIAGLVLAVTARAGFVHGMDLALAAGAGVAAVGAVLTLVLLPSRGGPRGS
jgi:EmrB/QacA subfamily drug resistance transporter